MTTLPLAQAITQGLRRSLEADPQVVLMGEDIGKLGGVFRVTDGLQKDFGAARVLDSPLAESGIVGTAIGMALYGFRPVVEIQFDGFVFPAFDQIVVQLARMRYRSRGALQVPVTIRLPFGGGIGSVEHHSESPEAYFAGTPGLRVVTPGTADDAYWMVQQAVTCDDPVIFLEPKRRYWQKGEVDTSGDVSTRPALDAAVVRRTGADCTVLCYGPTVTTCLDAATAAAADGISLEVVDLRSLAPIDWATVQASVQRTGRAVVVHEAARTGGLGAEIGQRITETCFYVLEAPVQRVTGWDTPYPPSRIEDDFLPDVDRVLDAVDRPMGF